MKSKVALYFIILAWSVLFLTKSRMVKAAAPIDGNLFQRVKANERLLDLIKMDYNVDVTRSKLTQGISSEPQQLNRLSQSEKKVNGYRGTWAQDGIKQYLNKDHYSTDENGKKTVEFGSVDVIDGEVHVRADKPDFKKGAISKTTAFRWTGIGPARLGLRYNNGKYKLSDLIEHESTVIMSEEAEVNGRKVYDVLTEVTKKDYIRIWLDKDYFCPVRFAYYDEPPQEGVMPRCEVNNIKVKQISNGGYFPVYGERVTHFPDVSVTSITTVDPSSISTRREDIPDSLFSIVFPKGATIINTISGITTVNNKVEDTRLERIVDGVLVEFGVERESGLPHVEQSSGQLEEASAQENSREIRNERGAGLPVIEGREHASSTAFTLVTNTVASFIVTVLCVCTLSVYLLKRSKST